MPEVSNVNVAHPLPRRLDGETESQILTQARKGQGETNERLDAILADIKVRNRWLAHISQQMGQAPAAAAPVCLGGPGRLPVFSFGGI